MLLSTSRAGAAGPTPQHRPGQDKTCHTPSNEVQLRLGAAEFVLQDAIEELVLFGEPYLVRPRLGQGSFRVLVTDTYHAR